MTAIAEFELERATTFDFKNAVLHYQGADLATYISGLSNGSYYFRVREIRNNQPLSEWSSTVTVVVEHHSLGLAFTLFGLGGLVFILTLTVVVVGARRTIDPDEQSNNSQSETAGI